MDSIPSADENASFASRFEPRFVVRLERLA